MVDTAQLFPHPRGPPYRMALRDLSSKHLGRIIQASTSNDVGHSAAIDAQVALELLRWKMINEPEHSPFRNPTSEYFGSREAAHASNGAGPSGSASEVAPASSPSASGFNRPQQQQQPKPQIPLKVKPSRSAVAALFVPKRY